LKKKLILINLN